MRLPNWPTSVFPSSTRKCVFLPIENCERPIVEALRDAGHDVSYVAEWASGLDDDLVFSVAHWESRVLLTSDQGFGQIAERRQRRPSAIMLMRLDELSMAGRTKCVMEAIAAVGQDMFGRILLVEPGRVRSGSYKTISP